MSEASINTGSTGSSNGDIFPIIIDNIFEQWPQRVLG